MPTTKKKPGLQLKPLSHAVLVACISLGGTAITALPSLAHAQTSSTLQSFDIPAGSLEAALQQFAAQSGISLAYSPTQIQGRQSAGVQGQHSPGNALNVLLSGSGLHASALDNGSYRLEQVSVANSASLPKSVVTGGRITEDELGHNRVYNENVTSVYQGREELQRFQVTNPGDVFKGMNGVYSMDTRSSQAITPNIRGITGEGRVPLTIDGTEQSTNVWLHTFGAGNRSYVDPALFRSIEVEKGPSLSRGIKSGVGGAVNIRTIEADDIIPEGDSWGVEVNVKASGNTKKATHDPASFFGKDYRDIPGATRWGTSGVNLASDNPRQKSSGTALNLDDHNEVLTIAGRNEFADILVSRSERTQGNYYAGKRNADRYEGHDLSNRKSVERLIPNLTKLYAAGSEVYNTDSETDTTLIKNNWYLPYEQKIGLQFMRTDTRYGETTPGDSVMNWQYREAFEVADPTIDFSTYPLKFVHERPRSELRLDSYKINYEVNPKDVDWLNLEASLWQTKADGKRYQTGANPWGLNLDAATQISLSNYDWMYNYILANEPENLDLYMGMFYPDGEPEHDGTIIAEGRQWTTHDRKGFDVSNLFQVADNLQLLLSTSYQEEKLSESVQNSDIKANGLFPSVAGIHRSTGFMGPRSGERKEYSALFNLSWQATDWLNLTAGTRYTRYKGKDVGLSKMHRLRDERFDLVRKQTGVELQYRTVMTVEEEQRLKDISNGYITVTPEEREQFFAGRRSQQDQVGNWGPAGTWYWLHTTVVPMKDGKMDSSKNPFANGELDINKTIENPWSDGYINEVNVEKLATRGIKHYEYLDVTQGWEAPEDHSGDSFSPVLSATAHITSFGTGFIRYAQTTRFASINELTTGTLVHGDLYEHGSIAINGGSKPERSTNWEVGYNHDLRQFFPSLLMADARISYYNTQIKNFFDRSYYYDTIQFDKKKTQGIELQSRFDSGRYFGSLAATYRLKQKLCDKDYASGMDPIFNRIPSCITGGFPGTYSGSSLQPKYSIDLLLGTRLFNDKLELGYRSTYHKGAENKQLDRLLSSTTDYNGTVFSDIWYGGGGLDFFYYQSVLLHDVYANLNLNNHVSFNLGITNLTDEYYLDPMSKILVPAPGRTASAGVTISF